MAEAWVEGSVNHFTTEVAAALAGMAQAHFEHLSPGTYLQRRGVIGRVEGFRAEFHARPGAIGPLRLGEGLTAYPAVEIRVAARERGVLKWSAAAQILGEGLIAEWAAADADAVRRTLAAIGRPVNRLPRAAYIDREEEEGTSVAWNR